MKVWEKILNMPSLKYPTLKIKYRMGTRLSKPTRKSMLTYLSEEMYWLKSESENPI